MNNKIALSDKDYASGTTIFIKKDDEGAGVGAGYTVEIYNNGTKVDTMHKDTRAETLDVVNQYKAQYNTSRSFQNEIEIFVTYPEKDSVYEENKKENKKLEASMEIDNILMKQAGHIEQLLNRIINPEAPIKIRTAEEVDSISLEPNVKSDTTDESIANEIFEKLKQYSIKIINSGKEESEIKSELYNKIKGWIYKIQDAIKKYSDMNGQLNADKIIDNIIDKIVTDKEFPNLAKEQLKKNPGSPGTNQFSKDNEEINQEQPKAASITKEFWKFASSLKGEYQIEDVFNHYSEENKIEDRKALWNTIEKDIEIAFNKEGMSDTGTEQEFNVDIKEIASEIHSFIERREIQMARVRDYLKNKFNELYNHYREVLSSNINRAVQKDVDRESIKNRIKDIIRNVYYANNPTKMTIANEVINLF